MQSKTDRSVASWQYRSLKNKDTFYDAETLAWHLVSRPQRVFAHLAFHAARIPSFAAGDHAFFEYFVKNRVVESFSRQRGEWRPRPITSELLTWLFGNL